MAGIALDLGSFLSFYLRNDINICGKRVVAITLSSSAASSRTSLVNMVLLVGLALMGRLSIRHVSRGKISKLSPFKVFFLLLSRLVPLETLDVNFTGT